MQYLVPQGVETEDKIIGPLSFKDFIFVCIGTAIGFLGFRLGQSFSWFFLIPFAPLSLLFLAFGFVKIGPQPFQKYFFSFLVFLFRPKKRFWKKGTLAKIPTITPKKPKEEVKKIAPEEAVSRLQEVSSIVDTRGWGRKSPIFQEPAEEMPLDLEKRIVSPLPQTSLPPKNQLPEDILEIPAYTQEEVNKMLEEEGQKIIENAKKKMEELKRAKIKKFRY